MNIVKLQNDLKNVPDQALIGYVQNPTGQVPTYLALAELQRRKEMREKYQQQQTPETTVADDLKQQAQPSGLAMLAKNPAQGNPTLSSAPTDQGVAGLPTGDMYNEQNFATGGIVAFADGGPTMSDIVSGNFPAAQRFREGYAQMPDMLKDPMLGLSISGNAARAAEEAVARQAQLKAFNRANKFGTGVLREYTPEEKAIEAARLRANIDKIKGGITQTGIKSSVGDPLLGDTRVPRLTGEEGGMGGLRNLGYGPDYKKGGVVGFADGGDTSIPWYTHMKLFGTDYSLVPPSPDEIRASQDKVSPNPFLGGMPETNSSYVPYSIAAPQEYPSANKPIPGSKVAGNKTESKPTTTVKQEAKAPVATSSVYAPEKVKSLKEYADELQGYLGVDEGRKALMDRMARMDAAAAKQAEQAPWMALAQAGFGMAAGKSPFALQNIGEGAMAGLKSYGEAQDKMAALEEKRFGLLADINKADRAEKVAVAKYGAESKQAVEERNFKRKLQEQHDNVLIKMNDADNQAALAKAALANRLDQKDILKYKNDYRANHPEYIAWQKKAIEDKGKNVVNTQEFKNASDALLNQLIARDLNQASGVVPTGSVKFLGYES